MIRTFDNLRIHYFGSVVYFFSVVFDSCSNRARKYGGKKQIRGLTQSFWEEARISGG